MDLPNATDPNHAAYREAAIRKLVQRRAAFFRHLLVYLAVVLGASLVAVILVGTGIASSWRQFGWIPIMAGGWGIGLVTHAVSVFVTGGVFSVDWEERKVQELLARQAEAPVSAKRV
jgi:thiosulfate reductase cytochrome b subunit